MLRVLVRTQIREHPSRPVLGLDLGSHLTNHLKELRQEVGGRTPRSVSEGTCILGMTTMWTGQKGRVW